MKEKVARNRKIYLDHKDGMSWRKLLQKYDLSVPVLRVIVSREKLKRKTK